MNDIVKQANDLHDKNVQICNLKDNEPIKKTTRGMYVCVCACVYVCMYIYIHTHKHTHTHTHIYNDI